MAAQLVSSWSEWTIDMMPTYKFVFQVAITYKNNYRYIQLPTIASINVNFYPGFVFVFASVPLIILFSYHFQKAYLKYYLCHEALPDYFKKYAHESSTGSKVLWELLNFLDQCKCFKLHIPENSKSQVSMERLLCMTYDRKGNMAKSCEG